MKGIKPTVADTCFNYDALSNKVTMSFHYPDTSLSFILVDGSLYISDWGDSEVDVYQGQCLYKLLDSYEIPEGGFKNDFVGKGLYLSSLTDTFSIALDENCIKDYWNQDEWGTDQ